MKASPRLWLTAVRSSALRFDWPLAAILGGAGILRLRFLGYSHFQGDEIKALYLPSATFPDFLLSQKKGPVQFLVTLCVRAVTGGYTEWQTRLPFALASLLGVYVLYRLVLETFGRRPALLAAGLAGGCGLLVAFGRIAQYQSFCILFVLLAALFLFRVVRRGDSRFVYPALVSYAFALLCHWDALAFAPTLLLLSAAAVRRSVGRRSSLLCHLAAASALAGGLVALFYVPYLFHPHVDDVSHYLFARVFAGQGLRTFARTASLLRLYFPPYYFVLAVPLLAAGAVLAARRGGLAGAVVMAWFATTFGCYMLLGGDPRSHVYNYFLPGIVLVALGIDGLARATGSAAAPALWASIVLFGWYTHEMIVDHSVEHPWYRKTILGYEHDGLQDETLDGVFGFPYRRGLDQVGALVRSGNLGGTLDTNERRGMAAYYFASPLSRNRPDYYVFVREPLSLERELPKEIVERYRRILVLSDGGRETIDVYEAPWRSTAVGARRR